MAAVAVNPLQYVVARGGLAQVPHRRTGSSRQDQDGERDLEQKRIVRGATHIPSRRTPVRLRPPSTDYRFAYPVGHFRDLAMAPACKFEGERGACSGRLLRIARRAAPGRTKG